MGPYKRDAEGVKSEIKTVRCDAGCGFKPMNASDL
jgi:hypothetical protein